MFIFGYFDLIYKYDLKINELKLLDTRFSTNSSHMKSIMINDTIYLFGGMPGSEQETFYIQLFNPETFEIFEVDDPNMYFWPYFIAGYRYYNESEPNGILMLINGQSIYEFQHYLSTIDFSRMSDFSVIPGRGIQIASLFDIRGCTPTSIKLFKSSLVMFQFTSDVYTFNIDHSVFFLNGSCWRICDLYSAHNPAECPLCVDGIVPVIYSAAIESYKTIQISIESRTETAMTLSPNIDIEIGECFVGEGLLPGSLIIDCQICNVNEFKIIPGNLPCFGCKNDDNMKGVLCHGSSKVSIAFNLWMTGFDENTKAIVSPFKILGTNQSVYSMQCAPGYCCQQTHGCYFLDSFINDTPSYIAVFGGICAKNRDFSVPLCARCVLGTFELFGSTQCGKCKQTSWSWLVVMLFLSILFAFILVFDSKSINITLYKASFYNNGELNWSLIMKRDETRVLILMFMKTMTYYYQGLLQILSSKSISNPLLPAIAIFGLSFDSTTNMNGICVFGAVSDPLLEILLASIFILFTFSHFVWLPYGARLLFYVKRVGIKTKRSETMAVDIVDSRSPTPISPTSSLSLSSAADSGSSRTLLFGVALLKLMLIAASTILTASFKLLACTTLPDGEYVHLYDASRDCFDFYWALGLIISFVVTLCFIILFVFIYKQSNTERENVNSFYFRLLSPYQPTHWHFEFVLFVRRFTISLFTSIRFIHQHYMDCSLIAILIILLLDEQRRLPFQWTRLNIIDIASTFCLIMIMASTQNTKIEYIFGTESFITICIAAPIVIFLAHLTYTLYSIRLSMTPNWNEKKSRKVQRLLKRTFVPIQLHGNDDVDVTEQKEEHELNTMPHRVDVEMIPVHSVETLTNATEDQEESVPTTSVDSSGKDSEIP